MRAGDAMTRVEAVPAAALAGAREAVKAHLRIEGSVEDGLIGGLAAAAVAAFESYAGLVAIERGVEERIVASGGWQSLSRWPVASIEAADGVEVDLDGTGAGLVRGAVGARIDVSYRAGLAEDWAALPEAARHGIVRLAAHLATHRDRADDAPPAVVAALWRPLRRMRLR